EVQASLPRRRFAAKLFEPDLLQDEFTSQHHIVLADLDSLRSNHLVRSQDRLVSDAKQPLDRVDVLQHAGVTIRDGIYQRRLVKLEKRITLVPDLDLLVWRESLLVPLGYRHLI